MKELKNKTTFNEATDGYTPVVPGTYPAHVREMEVREFEDSGRKLFKVTFVVADEVKQLTVNKMERKEDGNGLSAVLDADGKNIEVSANYLAGKTFYSKGIWLTPSPEQGQGWRNRNYKEFFENLGIEWSTNKKGDAILGEVEEDDVIGVPCLVKVVEEHYEKDGEQRTALKVARTQVWSEGAKISKDEIQASDIPF